MKLSVVLLALSAGGTYAFPGMRNLMVDLMKRQAPPTVPEPLFGDLATKGATTPVGTAILNCINGTAACQNLDPKTYTPPGTLGSYACAKDTCCVWDYITNDLTQLFTECDGTCNSLARAAIRAGFHDASAWDLSSTFGGADGSLFLSSDEITRPENNGLQTWRTTLLSLLSKYSQYGVGAADLAQFAHNAAVVICPLGPRTLTYVGRDSSSKANEPNLLPNTTSSSDVLISLFQNKTTSFVDLIALIGAHTTANQFFVDPTKAGQPLDSTPGIWDVLFYQQVLNGAPPPGVFRLPSDDTLNADNETHGGFLVFADPTTGQQVWNQLYAKAYLRMSLFGVNKINQLSDCTHVLPSQNPTFTNSTNSSCTTSTPSSSASYSTKASVTTAYTTSTVYTTKTYTTLKCAEQIFFCLWWTPAVETTTYPVATTVIPVTTPPSYSSKPASTSAKPTTTPKPPVIWWKE